MKAIKLKNLLPLFLIAIFIFSACDNNTQENGSNDIAEAENELDNDAESSESQTIAGLELAADSQSSYIVLPPPEDDGNMSVERALANRRSQRNFQNQALSLEQVSQILWAAYGITLPRPDDPRGGLRTTPSAGALFPLEVYVIVGNVDGIKPGVYRYIPTDHKIEQVVDGDIRSELSDAALGQRMVEAAPISVFYTAVFERTTEIYGDDRGIIYVYMEVGHSAQNVYLQAEAMGLGTCAIGAFIDGRIQQILNLTDDEEPLYLMPVGYYY